MKKLLTILILLLTVASQGWAEETTKLFPTLKIGGWETGADIPSWLIPWDANSGTIVVKFQEVEDGAQIRVQSKSASTDIFALADIAGNSAYNSTDKTFTINFTSANAEIVRAGFRVDGQNYTIKSIQLNAKDNGDNDVATNKELYDSYELYNWASVVIGKSAFADAAVGDIITATFEIPTPKVRFLADWTQIDTKQITSNEVTLTLTSDILSQISAKGNLRIDGVNFKIDKVSVGSTDIYTGTESDVIGNWHNNITIDKSSFTSVTENTDLTVTVSKYSISQLFQYAGTDNNYTGTVNTSADSKEVTLTVDATIKEKGLCIKGYNIDLKTVTLTPASTNSPILTGENEYSVASSVFSSLEAGGKIRVNFSKTDAYDELYEPSIELRLSSGDTDSKITGNYNSSTDADKTLYEVVVSDEASITSIQTNGLFIAGNDITIGNIDIIPAKQLTWFSEYELAASEFSTTEVGGTITMTFSNGTSPQIQIISPIGENNWSYSAGIDLTETTYSIDVTSDNCELIKQYGLKLKGNDATFVSVAVEAAPVTPQDLGAESTEIKASPEKGIVIPCWRFKNASVGDIITINMTALTEAGTITLKQSDNGWGELDNSAAKDKALAVGTTSFTYALTETSLPLVKANGLYVMGDKFTCTSVTLISAGEVPTSDARTNKYIYNVSKTITAAATATIAKEIFTNASIGDKLTLTVSSVNNATITLKSGEETIKSESGVSKTSYSYTLQSSDITKVQADGLTIAGSGFTLDKVHLLTEGEVAEVSDPVPDFSLDNFEADEGNTYDKTNHILTNTNDWSGMQLSIGDNSTYSGSSLEVRTKEVSKLKILVKYVRGGGEKVFESGVPGRRHVVSEIDNTKKIDQVIIQNQASGTLHFTYMALDPATQYELSVTAEDGSVTVKENNTVTEETFFDASTVLSLEPVAATNFEFEKWTIGGASSTDNPLSLTMDGDKEVVAYFKPKALAAGETRTLWENADGTDVSWNEIGTQGATLGAILEVGEKILVTVKSASTTETDRQVCLRDANSEIVTGFSSFDEVTSYPYVAKFTLTSDYVNKLQNGFHISGTNTTVTKMELYKPLPDTRTEKNLYGEAAMDSTVSDGITIATEKFVNISEDDVLMIYLSGTKATDFITLRETTNWTQLTSSYKEYMTAGQTVFTLTLNDVNVAKLKAGGLNLTGGNFTITKITIKTNGEIPADEGGEEEDDDDEEAIIDEKTGEADLTELSAQDDTKTTLTQNEDGSITMTTTEPYCAAQIWFSDPETVTGNVLKVELAESSVNVTVTVKYTDGTESQMSANTMVAKARGETRSASGTTVEVPLESGKEVQNIEVKNNVAGTITIKKMQVTTVNVFTNGVANLSMLKPQSNATYDTAAHTLATTKGWTGATISPVANENVSGKELLIEFADASKVKVAVKYRTDVEGPSTIMEKAAKAVRLALDNSKNIQEISIQPTEAAIVTFTKIAVNSEETDDGSLKPGKTITLWENATGETLAWNEVAKQDASVGETLKEYDELLITVSGVTKDCDWPKVFIRDASSEQAGNEVLLNDISSFPYTVRIVLTGEMAQQLKKGFSICGDGVTVTKLQVYRPEAPKPGDIHLADLNYGYNSSYDKGTHTITTTARWAARGWEIGDKRYNDKNLITVKFEPVDFPVTLKMEYTTGLQTAQATSVGVPAGRTELLLEIPSGISKLNRVYIIYENPGSVKLTEASVTYQDNLKLSTAIRSFEADGVIRDGRYDTDGWYNLRGMRIPEPKTSGVYIHGGKKVVIY